MKKINCKTAKKVSIISLLNQMGLKCTKKSSEDWWFHSPFRINERTSSFKVNISKNLFFDFGEGFGGTVIDFVMYYYKCNIQEALDKLANELNTFCFHQPTTFVQSIQNENKYEVKNVKNIQNKNLLDYANSRKLGIEILQKYCKEVHYQIKDKNYYGIGFQNNNGCYEIRNKYVKMVLGKKEITTIKNRQKSIILFESWSDFISFLTLYPAEELKHDYIILNSVTMLEKALIQLYNYINLICCFDNDEAGDKATNKVKEKFPKIFKDGRIRYKNSKDLNDYLINFPEL